MLTFRNMTIQDRDLVLPMVETFYQSDAVDHPVEREILEIMAWLEREYPAARRFRLEVTQINQGAIRLYEKSGYQYLRYDQMVLDKIK